MITLMSQPNNKPSPPAFWKSVILIIIFTFGIVILFGVIIFFLVNGAQQLRLPITVYIGIVVVISGIFAWLVKRLSDTVSGMSHYWFPEESEEQD